jgi:[ribosomal protein S5]-alanine N-acetyltransferase
MDSGEGRRVATIPILEADRLRLRPFAPADAPAVERMAGERRVSEMTLNIPHPYPAGLAARWIAGHAPAAAEGRFYAFAVERKDDGALLGAVAITPEARFRRAEIGYWLGLPHWNRGYMTEAARAVVAFGFARLGLVRIQATCYPRNPASAKVMQKVGMVYEGLLRGYVYKDGTQEDIAMYAVLRGDWAGAVVSGQ